MPKQKSNRKKPHDTNEASEKPKSQRFQIEYDRNRERFAKLSPEEQEEENRLIFSLIVERFIGIIGVFGIVWVIILVCESQLIRGWLP